MMYDSQINIRYARSLYLAAEEKGDLDLVKEDIEVLFQLFEENHDIDLLLEHPLIRTSRKIEILSSIFKDKVTKHTWSFLNLIVKNKRENHLKNICRDFISIYKKSKGIRTAVLTTSFELTRTHKEKIKKAIEEVFQAPVELNTKIDESIIGGLIIQVDDKQLDLSVMRQIEKVRGQFVNIDFNAKRKIK